MAAIPLTKGQMVIRTDFSNQESWEKIRDILGAPIGNFDSKVVIVDDTDFKGATKGQLLGLVRASCTHSFVVIVDERAILDPDHPVLIVDLRSSLGREFRAIPSAVEKIETTLSMAFMGFEHLADAVDGGGVFRGMREFGL
jgi:hypothetical protein